MINGARFNSAALNGPSSIVVHEASADWSAEASLAPIESRQQHAAKADTWVGTLQSIFYDALEQKYAFWEPSLSVTATATFNSSLIQQASADWTGTFSTSFTERKELIGEASWGITATLTALPDAKLADPGVWLASATTPGDFVATRIQAGAVDWDTGTIDFSAEPTLTHGAMLSMAADVDFYVNPKLQEDGDTHWQHDGQIDWEGKLDWDSDLDKEIHYSAPIDWEQSTNLTIQATLHQAVSADWQVTSSVEIKPTKIVQGALSISANGDLDAHAQYIADIFELYLEGKVRWAHARPKADYAGYINWNIASGFALGPTIKLGADAVWWFADGQLEIEGVVVRPAALALSLQSTFTAQPTRTKNAAANWDGAVQGIFYGGILTKTPAGESRTYQLGAVDRTFSLEADETANVFEVAA